MSFVDSKLKLVRASRFYPVGVDWSSLKLVEAAPNTIESAIASAGQTALEEFSTAGLMGLKMTTATDLAAALFELPDDYAIEHKGYLSVIWTSKAAAVGARDITWEVQIGGITPGVNVAGTASVTLSLGAQAPTGTSTTIEETVQKEIPANTFVAADRLINWTVQLKAFDATFTEDKFLLGLFLEYTRRATRHPLQQEANAFDRELQF